MACRKEAKAMSKILTDEEIITLIGQFMAGMSRTVTEEEITLLMSWAEKARLDEKALQHLLAKKAVIRLKPDGLFELEMKRDSGPPSFYIPSGITYFP